MTACGERADWEPARRKPLGLSAAACLLLLLAMGCEPPGKPKPEPRSEDITDFKTLFHDNCSGCHGPEGQNGPARPLNNALYLAVIPRHVLQKTIENGRPGTAMPPWLRSQGGPLTEKQIIALVNGIEQNWARPAGFRKTHLPSYSGDPGDAANGQKLFMKDCYMCHGPRAPIGPVTDPVLLQLSSDQLLRTSIIEGRPDFGMPDYRMLNMGRALSDQDIGDLVAYLVSLRPEAPNENAHINENGTGQSRAMTKGNEGSGNGPGSPRFQKNEGNKGTGSSSQRGGK